MTSTSTGRVSIFLTLLVFAVAWIWLPSPAPAPSQIIPAPLERSVGSGVFHVHEGIPIETQGDAGAQAAAAFLRDTLEATSGQALVVSDVANSARAIRFERDPALEGEAYAVDVTRQGIEIRAGSDAGLFYGGVTVWQMLTPWPARQSAHAVPVQTITDAPEFAWRGVLLDSARHMQSVEFIKDFIDWMALHKLNTLHWHLTDDQGWRLEIRRYPRLAEVGGYRVPAGDAPAEDVDPETGEPRLYGGFYTQDEVREIVAHAATRQVTIVPEIDVPGHALAAVVAYPELASVENPPTAVMADWGVYPYLFNVEESTFEFLENVLDEVLELFPSTYIHVGGDEPPKNQWRESEAVQARMRELGIADERALQGYFTQRLDDYLTRNGRRLIGWDEIIEGGLSANATVMSWRGLAGAVEAAEAGHDTVLSPGSHMYLDFRQANLADEPPGRARLIRLEDLYGFEPFGEELDEEQRDHVLGVQANIWTEHIRTHERVNHMAFPRLAALSELSWSTAEHRNFDDFIRRLYPMTDRYRALGIGFAESELLPQVTLSQSGSGLELALSTSVGIGDIRFTLDGTEPTIRSPRFDQPIAVAGGVALSAALFDGTTRLTRTIRDRLEPADFLTRRDDQLAACHEKLVIYIDDDAPISGERANFGVDIFDACWRWDAAPTADIEQIEVVVGQLPYNFQLMAEIDDVVVRPLDLGAAVLLVRENQADDACRGPVVARLPLDPAFGRHALTSLVGDFHAETDTANLCFTFHTGQMDPLWVIDSVRLMPAGMESENEH